MKILHSSPVSSFGGLNFVLEELDSLKINDLINCSLPKLASQSKYSWKDIFYSYWSLIFCGGDCAEDVAVNLKNTLRNNPFVYCPSPDRLLNRLKDLSIPSIIVTKNRSLAENEISLHPALNSLNIKMLKRLKLIKSVNQVLDYDNTFIFNNKADAKRTYKKENGYCPGVSMINDCIVYVENRNGNSAPHSMQDDTIHRMMSLLDEQGIKATIFRADSASYQFSTITTARQYFDTLFVRAKINTSTESAIRNISNWKAIEGTEIQLGSTTFIPFQEAAKRAKKKDLLEKYRLIVTRKKRKDGQINLYTGEAYVYGAIMTNDFKMTAKQVIEFYNQRGKQEREFDILKNDFIWNKMPFSKLEQNTVFLILTAMCRNIYSYIIRKFSMKFKHLSGHFRLKKFIFRFICIPAKWIRNGGERKLRIYGQVAYKT